MLSHFYQTLVASLPNPAQTLVDVLPHDYWIMDCEGRYVAQNDCSRARWGDLVGSSLNSVRASEADVEQWRDNDRHALAGHAVLSRFDLVHTDGVSQFFSFLTPLQIDGEVRGIIGMNLEVTEPADEPAEVGASEVAVRGFVHSLNNQLTALIGAASLASRELQSSPSLEHIRSIEQAADSCHRLAEQLLHRDPAPSEVRSADLAAVAGGVVERFRTSMPAGVHFDVELSQSAPVRAHPSQLTRIVSSLLLRACQSLSDGRGTVRVAVSIPPPDAKAATHARNMACLTVADDGVACEDWRLPSTVRPVDSGKPADRGLGLHTVRRLTDRLGGRFRVRSRVDEGTSVDVQLPLIDEQP